MNNKKAEPPGIGRFSISSARFSLSGKEFYDFDIFM